MTDATPASPSFKRDLVAVLPQLRVHALGLTRHRANADDLVHDTVCNAINAQASFTPGSNFQAWAHRILRNRFISNLRKVRDTVAIDDLPPERLRAEPPHEHLLALKELAGALKRLPVEQREALIMVALQGMSYDELAGITDCAVGTAKSRVFRARRQLEAMLEGTDKRSVADAQQRQHALRRAATPEPTGRLPTFLRG